MCGKNVYVRDFLRGRGGGEAERWKISDKGWCVRVRVHVRVCVCACVHVRAHFMYVCIGIQMGVLIPMQWVSAEQYYT